MIIRLSSDSGANGSVLVRHTNSDAPVSVTLNPANYPALTALLVANENSQGSSSLNVIDAGLGYHVDLYVAVGWSLEDRDKSSLYSYTKTQDLEIIELTAAEKLEVDQLLTLL